MNAKLISAIIVILMIVGSFSAIGRTSNNNETECRCNNTEYVGLTDSDIAYLQNYAEEMGYTFTVDRNPATYYSVDQLCGFIGSDIIDDAPDNGQLKFKSSNLPDHFDWSKPDKNYKNRDCTTDIKNQGGCGTCWAFGTVAPLESKILIEQNQEVDLSEQWLVSCNTAGYSSSCDRGGRWAHDWHAGTQGKCGGTGAVLESQFPYDSGDGSIPDCRPVEYHSYFITEKDWVEGPHSIPEPIDIKQAIYDHGPVSASVHVDKDENGYSLFQSYSSGIFDTDIDGSTNHAIVLVGWKDDSSVSSGGYWILRNSWGTGWGENGYMRIAYGCQRVGFSANYIASYMPIGAGNETVTLTINEVTHEGNDYENIDLDGSGGEWWFKVKKLSSGWVTQERYNLKEGATPGFMPWDLFDWEETYTWADIDQGYMAYTASPVVDVRFGFYDFDSLSNSDHADISPDEDERDFVGTYNLITDELKNSNGDTLEKSGGFYITRAEWDGNPLDIWCDNAQVKFDISDSFNPNDHMPTLDAPSSFSFGNKEEFGSYSDSFTIENTQTHEWSDDLDIESITITSGSDWISSASSSKDALGPGETASITVETKNLQGNGDYSGEIKIQSNGGTKYVDVDLSISAKPDLDCSDISWSVDVGSGSEGAAPGDTVSGSFTVSNIGAGNTNLDWSVDLNSLPSLGSNWQFTPNNGNDLKPEDGEVTVQVTFTVAESRSDEYEDSVTVLNDEDSSDSETASFVLFVNSPPVISSTSCERAGFGKFTYSASATDTDGDEIVTYQFTIDGNTITDSDGSVTRDVGLFPPSAKVKAQDEHGKWSSKVDVKSKSKVKSFDFISFNRDINRFPLMIELLSAIFNR